MWYLIVLIPDLCILPYSICLSYARYLKLFYQLTNQDLSSSNRQDISGNSRTMVQIYHSFKGVLAIRRIFSLVDMITNTKNSNCPNVFRIGVVQQ